MKLIDPQQMQSFAHVTLCVRVWIEMYPCTAMPLINPVTLCVRVWIEISSCVSFRRSKGVTLCVRVWIEIIV